MKPAGLHVHLVAWRRSLRFALWLERYADPLEYRKERVRPGEPHPGCDPLPPPGVSVNEEPHRFLARLPRLGNGFPIPLPGVLPTWDLSGFSVRGRQIAHECFSVLGFLVPPARTLGLRQVLLAWRTRFGDGLIAPQAARVIELLGDLEARIAEGPLLPTLTLPEGAAADSLEWPFKAQPLAWVPPVSVAHAQELLEPLKRDPHLGDIQRATATNVLAERSPARFVRFLLEILGAATEERCVPYKPDRKSGWTQARLRAALLEGEPGLIELHRSHGSSLHPHHPVFGPLGIPAGHMEGRIHAARTGGGEPLRLELGMGDRGAFASLAGLEQRRALRHSVVDDEGRALFRPAQVLFRDWTIVAKRDPLFRRPELLGDGSGAVSRAEAERLLVTEIRGSGYELERFLEREGLDRDSYRTKGFAVFSAAPASAESVRVRVHWDLVEAGGGPDPTRVGAARLVRFSPRLTLGIGEKDVDLAEAEALLERSTSSLLTLGGELLERAVLLSAVELARARKAVLARLRATHGLTLQEVVALEDEWSPELDAARQESVFAALWMRFLDSLPGGAGVPLLAAPAGFRGELRPYQARGYSWLSFLASHGLGACLADDMGLGKTVQVLALLARSGDEGRAPNLVVCPTSVVTNWAREAARFTPRLSVYVHQGTARVRDDSEFLDRVRMTDLVVTSWALARRDAAKLEAIDWNLVVADEAQNLKNPAAIQTRTVKKLAARARIALTGTPVENRLRDLWSIFDFASPGLLGGPTRFARAFATPIRSGSEPALARLQRRVGPFLLRRTKPEVASDLPPKQEQDVFCELTREQVALYRAMSEAALSGISDKSGFKRKAHILQALLHLKQICNHPDQFTGDRKKPLALRSGKLERLVELLEELLDEGQPTLVFTQFTEMGELLGRAIEERFELTAPFFHGGLGTAARDRLVAEFQSEGGPPVLLLSLRAGGTGLNLTRARAVIHYDRWWNPAVEDQATDRAHRIGQTGKVNVYKLVTQGTVEDRIQAMLLEKRELARKVLAATDDGWLTELDDDALREFLVLGEIDADEDAAVVEEGASA